MSPALVPHQPSSGVGGIPPRLTPGVVWSLLGETLYEWYEDRAPRLGAALAYYTTMGVHRIRRVRSATAMPAEGAPKAADTLDVWVKSAGRFTAAADTKPSSLRARLRLAVGASDASQNNA